MSAKSGKIITFYSYKGGTGRTMAISNVAWILASNGYDVLLIDWDLEAPGLHRYLRPFLVDPELTHTRGLIDFVWDAARMNMTQVQGTLALKLEFPSLEDYVVGLDWTFRGNGSISFLPAGQQDENYAQRVNTFSWDNFYERLGGGKLLEAERDALRANYDYILIDSRTGVSDTSSICTVQMPDLLVVLFTLNRQSINGAVAVAESIQAQREQSFPIYPVPTRIENAETDRLAAAIAYARRMFAPFLIHVQSDPGRINLDQQASYWKEVETPYRTFYAFEEVPAAFKDEPGGRSSVLAANERIAYWITDRIVSSLEPESEERRKDVVDAYAFREDEARRPWVPPASSSLLEKAHGTLRRHRRRFATTTVAIAVALLALAYGYTQNELNTTQRTLGSTQSELLTTQSDLKGTRSELEGTRSELEVVSTQLTTVSKELTNVSTQLRALSGKKCEIIKVHVEKINEHLRRRGLSTKKSKKR